jgi:hypothetical protein
VIEEYGLGSVAFAAAGIVLLATFVAAGLMAAPQLAPAEARA